MPYQALIKCFLFGWFGLCSVTAFAQLPDTSARKLTNQFEPSTGNPYNLPVDSSSKYFERQVTTTKAKGNQWIDWSNLPYFMDDLMFIGSLNRTGLHYSNEFRNLRVANGYTLGFEIYYPLLPKAFLHYGLSMSRNTFEHNGIAVRLRQLNLPFIMAYELPVFRDFDFRFLLGGQMSFFRRGDYEWPNTGTPDFNLFWFEGRDFQSFDLGMCFGLSMEYNNFYGRLRNFTGTRKLDPADTGMINSWHIELGYFPFRKLRSMR